MIHTISNKKGFTLVELLVAIAAATVVIGAVYSLYVSFLRHSTGQDNLIEIHQEARIAVDRLVKEIRVAGCYFAESRIRTADAGEFEFESDLDPDPFQLPWRIRYDLAGNQLQRSAAQYNGTSFPAYSGTGLNQPVSSHISSLTFAYFDENGDPLTPLPLSAIDRDNIRRVDIHLEAQTDTPNPGTNKLDTITLDTSVYLRCDANQSTDTTPCALPTNLAVTDPGICGRLDLTWTKSSDSDAAGYKIYYRPTGTASYTGLIDVAGGSTQAHTITGLDNGVQYDIVMRCLDSAGNLNVDGNGDAVFTDPPVTGTPNDTTAPDIPTGVDATAGDGFVTVSWTGSSAVDTGGYNIYRSDDNGGSYAYIGEVDSNYTSYQDLTITNCPAQPYRYRVTSWDCANNMVPFTDSSVVAETTYGNGGAPGADKPTTGVTDTNPTETTPPGDPVSFQALAGATQIYTSYATPSDTDLQGVRILRKDDGGAGGGPFFPTDENDFPPAVGPNGTMDYEPLLPAQTYALIDSSGIVLDTTYYYRAFAYDGCGNFSPGAISQATAKPCGDAQFPGDPDEPGSGTKTVCSGATFTWSAPTTYNGGIPFTPPGTDDLVGYNIYRNQTGVFNPADLINTGGPVTSTSFSDAGLVPGNYYYYWVTALDCAANEGPPAGPTMVIPSDIDWDSNVTVTTSGTSGISGSQHNIVRLGLRNLGLTDAIIDTATITWTKTTANIKKVTLIPFGGSSNIIWDDTSLPLTASGVTIDFTAYEPDDSLRQLSPSSTLNELIIEFRESDNGGFVDMRGDTLNVSLGYTNYDAGSSCTATTFSVPVPTGPTISNSTQDRPAAPTTSNLNTGNVVVAAGTQDSDFVWTDHSVTVQATITPEAGTTLTSAILYYNTTDKSTTTPPVTDYSSSPSGWTALTMCNVAPTNVYQTADSGMCTATNIPLSGSPTVGQRVWYYIVAVDDNMNFDIQPEPATGVYTYDHESKFDIVLTVTRSGAGGEDVAVTVDLTDEGGAPVSDADITVAVQDVGETTKESGAMTETATPGTYTYAATNIYHDLTIDVTISVSKDTFTTAACGAMAIEHGTSNTEVTCN